MIEAILIGAKAAGAIIDVFGKRQSYELSKRAAAFEEGQMRLRMQQDAIASQEQSLQGLESLTEILATQRAFAGAKGINPGQGSALTISQASETNFKKDERARNLTLNFMQQQKKAQIAMSRISTLGQKSALGMYTAGKAIGFGLDILGQTQLTGGKSGGKLTLE